MGLVSTNLFDYGGTWPLKPDSFDTWSFGFLIVELFTQSYLRKKLKKEVRSWTKEAYPVIYNALKNPKFCRLVGEAFPKAHGTVNLKSVRHLAAYAVSFRASKRPTAKELYHLLIMMDLQQKFFSKINMQFQKDLIWRSTFDRRELENVFSRMAIEDDRECLQEDNIRKMEGGAIINTVREQKAEKESFTKNLRAKNPEEMKRSTTPTKNVAESTLYNVPQKGKKEKKKALFKTEDQIKITYSAFTFPNSSAFENSVVDLKAVGSEISGFNSDETKYNSLQLKQYPENIKNSRLYTSGASSRQEIISNGINKNEDAERKEKLKNGKEVPSGSFVQEKHDKENSDRKGRSVIDGESSNKDGSRKVAGEKYPDAQGSGGKTVNEEKNDQNKDCKTIDSKGKQLMRSFMKWGFDGCARISYNYDMSSPSNYIHSLSKQLTRKKQSECDI